MILIPTDTENLFYTQVTTLDGRDYVLEFRYNSREECYYLNVSQTDDTVLAQGIKIVSNYRLFQSQADFRMPLGELIAIAYGPDDSPAKLGELGLGQRVELTYMTVDEMRAAGIDGWRL